MDSPTKGGRYGECVVCVCVLVSVRFCEWALVHVRCVGVCGSVKDRSAVIVIVCAEIQIYFHVQGILSVNA